MLCHCRITVVFEAQASSRDQPQDSSNLLEWYHVLAYEEHMSCNPSYIECADKYMGQCKIKLEEVQSQTSEPL